jgi:hypothetical protein
MIKRFFDDTEIKYYKIPLTKKVIVSSSLFSEKCIDLSEKDFNNLCNILKLKFRSKTSNFLGFVILQEK